MTVIEKINGRVVTKEESAAYFRERNRIINGDPDFNPFAEMARLGVAPRIRTNDTFMRGKKHGAFLDMTAEDQDECLKAARRAGVNPNGKFYYGQVARFDNDPLAWCGSDSDVLARARALKVKIELNGRVYDYRERKEEPKPAAYEVAPDIVERYAQMQIDDNPDMTPTEQQQLKESLRENMTPQWIDPQ